MTNANPLLQSTSKGLVERRLPEIGMRYLYLEPADWSGERCVIVVHGISRNHKEHAKAFAATCAEADTALIIPRFSISGYRGYQRLRRGKRGLRSDEALLAVLDDAKGVLGPSVTTGLRLFGFSGGAQFAHRFSLLHPSLVSRQTIASAGFYTFPTEGAKYPYGMNTARHRFDIDARGFSIPTRVFVGDEDTERDEDLRVGATVDRQQGRNRVERARRFVLAARAFSAHAGRVPDCSLRLLAGCNHEFSTCVRRGDIVRQAMEFLVPEAQA